jgi:predicted metal-dependent HD superfamily phosphohydrolase
MHIDKKMNDFVINLLKTKIPANYYYHNYEHTLYVIDKVMEIGKQENCSEKELELLTVAALWHDTGYIKTYAGHEQESCKLARQYLPGYGYTNDDINTICAMIMATKIPQSPQNKPEEIIADADMEYLGTNHTAALANHLFKELNALNPFLTEEEWNKTEIDFLTAHHYFTGYCKVNKEPTKQAYLKSLINTKA